MPQLLERVRLALAERYDIERELGRGGMAVVYLARDLKHSRLVAIKVLKPDLAVALGAERFLREIEISARLTHPHILTLIDSGQTEGLVYYVMPYVKGQSLRDRLDRQPQLPVEDAVRIVREVSDALAHAHAMGVVHRDVKPENILFEGRHAVVTDFGVAKAVKEASGVGKLTTAGVALGTPAYMSPEQAVADPHADHRSDIYSVGVIAYEMLSGQPPFVEPTAPQVLSAHMVAAAKPVSHYRDTVPPLLEQIVMRCLEKNPADRWQSTDELVSQLENLATPSGGITAVGSRAVARPARKHWIRLGILAATVIAVAIAALLLRPQGGPVPDPNVLVVTPFTVLDPLLEDLWGEGVAQIVANNLDGAGPLTAVPPSVVFRGWDGTADAATARDVATETGAGLAVFGRLVGAGPDSVRLSATLIDVVADVPLAEFSLRDRIDRVDRLADSLSVRIVGELSRIRPIGAARLSSLGSSSPQAVKEFLRGEQFYRRMQLDSARMHYERAIAEDVGFALAYSRLARVGSWTAGSGFAVDFLRAGALNHGLARRESLLIVTDSLYAATGDFLGDSADWARFERLLATADEAVRAYPLEPQTWYALGEIRLHEGTYAGVPADRAREAFERAVELDSTFAPAYIHLIEFALLREGPEAALRVIDEYLARGVGGSHEAAARAVRAQLDPATAGTPEAREMLESLDAAAHYSAHLFVEQWPDPDETAVRQARAWAASDDSLAGAFALAAALSHRGHLHDAYESRGGRWWVVFGDLALLGVVPPDTVDATTAAWLDDGRGWSTYSSLRWWAARGDTATLDRATAFFEGVERPYATAASRAYRALAVGDSADALQQLSELRTWPYYYVHYERLQQAQLLAASGRHEEAAQLLDEWRWPLEGFPHAGMVLWALERARANDVSGNRDAAVEDYSYVLDAWRRGDPEVQAYVDEARAALQRLTGEPWE